MKRFRSLARGIATVWLVCQAASVAAFVPGTCCLAHAEEAAAKQAEPPCHGEQPAPEPEPGEACPMHDAGGAACPMHDSSRNANCCAMTNACQGPGTQLANLFAFVGVLDAPAASVTSPALSAVPVEPPALLLCRLVRPDAPPPKA